MKLTFPEITFSAAHYIPGHSKCNCIHGHTYFIRNLEIEYSFEHIDKRTGISIDFGELKAMIAKFCDHAFIIPDKHFGIWYRVFELLKMEGVKLIDNRRPVPYTTVEGLADHLKQYIESNFGLPTGSVSFELYEGPKQGVKFP